MMDKEKLHQLQYSKSDDFTKALAECIHQAQGNVVDPMVLAETWKDELIKLAKSEDLVSKEWIKELRTKLDSLSKEDFEKVWAKYSRYGKEEPVSDVWHDANEEQPEEYRDFAFVDYDGVMWSRYRIEDIYHSWQSYVNMTGMTKWAYTSDLIKL